MTSRRTIRLATAWAAAAVLPMAALGPSTTAGAETGAPGTIVVVGAHPATAATTDALKQLARTRLARGPVAVVSANRPASVLVPPTRSASAVTRGLAATPPATDTDLPGAATAAAAVAGRLAAGSTVVLARSGKREAEAFAVAVDRAGRPNADGVAVQRLDAALRESAPAAPAPAPASSSGRRPLATLLALLALLVLSLVLLRRQRNAGGEPVARRIAEWSVGPPPMAFDADSEPEADAPRASFGRLQAQLDLGGPGLTAAALIGRTAVAIALLTAVCLLVSPLLLPIALLLPPLVARAVIRRRIRRRRAAFADQLGDTVQAIAAAMRAGHGISSAIGLIVNDLPDPMQDEMRAVVASERLGVSFDVAMAEAVARTGSRDLQQVGLVASLQREAGGNGAEALDRVVETIRARDDVRRLVTTLTAQGRMSRWVLTALPVGLALVLLVAGHGYLSPLVESPLGLAVTCASAGMVALGSFWIGRIVEIDV